MFDKQLNQKFYKTHYKGSIKPFNKQNKKDENMKFYQKKYPISDTAEYVVDYVYENKEGENFYFQLVRLSDNAILCAHKDVNDIIVYCWKNGIEYSKVSFI